MDAENVTTAEETQVESAPTEEVEQSTAEATEQESAPASENAEETTESAPVETESDKYQKRIGKLTAKRYEAEAEAKRLREELDQFKASQTVTDKPTLEGCDFDEEVYAEKLADYKLNKKLQEEAARQSAEAAQRAVAERQNAYVAKAQEFAEKHADFVDVVGNMPMTDAVKDLLLEAGSPELTYYYAKNQAELSELMYMTPAKAAIAMGQRLSAIATPKTPTKIPTSAPPVTPTLEGGGATTNELAALKSRHGCTFDD